MFVGTARGPRRDKSDGLSRAEIRCGFHAIQAEAKRQQEAAARRKRHEALRKEAREKEARMAEAARCEERLVDAREGAAETLIANTIEQEATSLWETAIRLDASMLS